MLSLFPDILFLAPFSIFFIRIALSTTLAYSAWRHLSTTSVETRVLGVLEIVVAITIGAGIWTQAGGIAAGILLAIGIWIPRLRNVALGTALLALVMALSLIVTGASIFAFDIPL